MADSDEINKLFDDALISISQRKSNVVSFESSSRQTITNPEIEVLFDAARDSITGSKSYTVKIETGHVDHIPADAAVLRIAAQAANIASRTVLTLKNFRRAPLILSKQTEPISVKIPLPLRIASALVDILFWVVVSILITVILLPNISGSAFWMLVAGVIPLIGVVTSVFFILILRKTFGEIVWGLVPSGSLLSLITRALVLPLFWFTPVCLVNLYRKEPLQGWLFGVEVRDALSQK